MQETTSKKSLRVLALCSALCMGGAFLPAVWAQSTDPGFQQDMKSAGHSTKNAAKDTGNGVKSGTKKTWRSTKHGTKKAAHKTARKTDQGARKVERKTSPNQ
ncbi:MAG: hypothetical protein ACYCOR_19535 [Acidobacteriaceae bacterium]